MFTRHAATMSKPMFKLLAALAVGAASLPALAAAGAPVTRDQVREELLMWKTTNMMSNSGEISEPPAVLEARDAFYSLQTDVMEEENRVAWQQWRLAQDETTPVLLVMEAE